MKKVLISVPPEVCKRIFSGEQTILVKKTFPKLEPPFECLVYCTNDKIQGELVCCRSKELSKLFGYGSIVGINKGFRQGEDDLLQRKVIGSFVCDRGEEITASSDFNTFWERWRLNRIAAGCGMNARQLCDFLMRYKNSTGKAWHITNAELFDYPMELWDYKKPCTFGGDCFFCKRAIRHNSVVYECKNDLQRPPASWCYVEY